MKAKGLGKGKVFKGILVSFVSLGLVLGQCPALLADGDGEPPCEKDPSTPLQYEAEFAQDDGGVQGSRRESWELYKERINVLDPFKHHNIPRDGKEKLNGEKEEVWYIYHDQGDTPGCFQTPGTPIPEVKYKWLDKKKRGFRLKWPKDKIWRLPVPKFWKDWPWKWGIVEIQGMHELYYFFQAKMYEQVYRTMVAKRVWGHHEYWVPKEDKLHFEYDTLHIYPELENRFDLKWGIETLEDIDKKSKGDPFRGNPSERIAENVAEVGTGVIIGEFAGDWPYKKWDPASSNEHKVSLKELCFRETDNDVGKGFDRPSNLWIRVRFDGRVWTAILEQLLRVALKLAEKQTPLKYVYLAEGMIKMLGRAYCYMTKDGDDADGWVKAYYWMDRKYCLTYKLHQMVGDLWDQLFEPLGMPVDAPNQSSGIGAQVIASGIAADVSLPEPKMLDESDLEEESEGIKDANQEAALAIRKALIYPGDDWDGRPDPESGLLYGIDTYFKGAIGKLTVGQDLVITDSSGELRERWWLAPLAMYAAAHNLTYLHLLASPLLNRALEPLLNSELKDIVELIVPYLDTQNDSWQYTEPTWRDLNKNGKNDLDEIRAKLAALKGRSNEIFGNVGDRVNGEDIVDNLSARRADCYYDDNPEDEVFGKFYVPIAGKKLVVIGKAYDKGSQQIVAVSVTGKDASGKIKSIPTDYMRFTEEINSVTKSGMRFYAEVNPLDLGAQSYTIKALGRGINSFIPLREKTTDVYVFDAKDSPQMQIITRDDYGIVRNVFKPNETIHTSLAIKNTLDDTNLCLYFPDPASTPAAKVIFSPAGQAPSDYGQVVADGITPFSDNKWQEVMLRPGEVYTIKDVAKITPKEPETIIVTANLNGYEAKVQKTIYIVDDTIIGSDLINSWEFTNDSEGWVSSKDSGWMPDSPFVKPQECGHSKDDGGYLYLGRGKDQQPSWGWWSSPSVEFRKGEVYRAIFKVASNHSDNVNIPNFRLLLRDGFFQLAEENSINSYKYIDPATKKEYVFANAKPSKTATAYEVYFILPDSMFPFGKEQVSGNIVFDMVEENTDHYGRLKLLSVKFYRENLGSLPIAEFVGTEPDYSYNFTSIIKKDIGGEARECPDGWEAFTYHPEWSPPPGIDKIRPEYCGFGDVSKEGYLALGIKAGDNLSYGWWSSPKITFKEDRLYRVHYVVSTDQHDKTKVPKFRLKINDEHFEIADIKSVGPVDFGGPRTDAVPDVSDTHYNIYFTLPDEFFDKLGENEVKGNITFEIIDSGASKEGSIILKKVDIYSQIAPLTNPPLRPGDSIQAAIDAASPGDTLYLSSGVYDRDSNININKSITIQSLDPKQKGKIVLGGGQITISADDVTIKDLAIESILKQAPSNDRKAAYTIYANGISDLNMENNIIRADTIWGIYVRNPGKEIKIYNNLLYTFYNEHLVVFGKKGSKGCHGIAVTGDNIFNTGLSGVTIEQNTVYNFRWNNVTLYGKNPRVKRNIMASLYNLYSDRGRLEKHGLSYSPQLEGTFQGNVIGYRSPVQVPEGPAPEGNHYTGSQRYCLISILFKSIDPESPNFLCVRNTDNPAKERDAGWRK